MLSGGREHEATAKSAGGGQAFVVLSCILELGSEATAQNTICPDPQDEKCPHFTRRIPLLSDTGLDEISSHPRITPDGSVVVFATASDPLELDSKDLVQVYSLGRSEFDGGVLSINLVSRKSGAAGAVAGASCLRPSVSDDGLVIVFDTSAPLADTKELGGPDGNGMSDVYVRDLRGAEPVTRRLSVRTVNGVPDDPNGPSFHAGISGDGNVVAFTSRASDLLAPNTDTNARDDVFAVFATDGTANPVRVSLDNCDRQSATTHFSTIGVTLPTNRGVGSVVSSVGPRIVFSGAPCDWDSVACPQNVALCASLNCVNCATAGRHQVYVRDFGSLPPTTRIVSRGVQGGNFVPGDHHSERPSISDDGLNIAFESLARNLTAVAGTDPDTFRDVFRLAESLLLDPTAPPIHISLPFMGGKSQINGHSHSPMQLDDEAVSLRFTADLARLARVEEHIRPGALRIDNEQGGLGIVTTNSRRRIGAEGERVLVATLHFDIQPGAEDIGEITPAFAPFGPYLNWLEIFYRGTSAEETAVSAEVEPLYVAPGLLKIQTRPTGPGDVNVDYTLDLADAMAILGDLFLGTDDILCAEAADFDGDGRVDISDPIGILAHLFLGDAGPPEAEILCGKSGV